MSCPSKGQLPNDMMDLPQQLAWHTWECFNGPYRRHTRQGMQDPPTVQWSQTSSMLRWRTPQWPLERTSFGAASSSGWSCGGRLAKGSGSPSIPHQVEAASALLGAASQWGATCIANAPRGPNHWHPPPPPRTGGQATQAPCSQTSATAGPECPAWMNPARTMKAPACPGAPIPRRSTIPGTSLPFTLEALAAILA